MLTSPYEWDEKTKETMMTKEGSTKIVNFMTPGVGVPVLGHCHINHVVEMLNLFKILTLTVKHRLDKLGV